MTNEELTARIKAGIEPAANMLSLWRQNTGLINKISRKYAGYAELEDLQQEGYIGLCNAVAGYDPIEGPFANYAALWIKQAMRRYIENNGSCVRIPSHMRQRIQEYRKMEQVFLQRYGREPTDSEMRVLLGLSRSEYESLRKGLIGSNVGSLDTPVIGDEDGESSVIDFVEGSCSAEDTAVENVQKEELKALLWPMVDELSDEQAQLIRMQYKDDISLNSAAASVGLTPSRARTITGQGLRALRRPEYTKKLRAFLPEKAEVVAYRGGVKRFRNTWASSTEKAAEKLLEESRKRYGIGTETVLKTEADEKNSAENS